MIVERGFAPLKRPVNLASFKGEGGMIVKKGLRPSLTLLARREATGGRKRVYLVSPASRLSSIEKLCSSVGKLPAFTSL